MPDTRPHLLSVCIENSDRLRMTEGFARTRGNGRVGTFSSGCRPSGHAAPRAVQFTREKNIDLALALSKGLDDLPSIRSGGAPWLTPP